MQQSQATNTRSQSQRQRNFTSTHHTLCSKTIHTLQFQDRHHTNLQQRPYHRLSSQSRHPPQQRPQFILHTHKKSKQQTTQASSHHQQTICTSIQLPKGSNSQIFHRKPQVLLRQGNTTPPRFKALCSQELCSRPIPQINTLPFKETTTKTTTNNTSHSRRCLKAKPQDNQDSHHQGPSKHTYPSLQRSQRPTRTRSKARCLHKRSSNKVQNHLNQPIYRVAKTNPTNKQRRPKDNNRSRSQQGNQWKPRGQVGGVGQCEVGGCQVFIRGRPHFQIRTRDLHQRLGTGLGLSVHRLQLLGICSLFNFSRRLLRGAHCDIFNRIIASDIASTYSLTKRGCVTIRCLPNRFSRHTTSTISYIQLVSPSTRIHVHSSGLLLFSNSIASRRVTQVGHCCVGTIRSHRGSLDILDSVRRTRIGPITILRNFAGVASTRLTPCYTRCKLTVGTSSLHRIIGCFHTRNHSPCRARLHVLSAC